MQATLFETGHGDLEIMTPEEIATPLARRDDKPTSHAAAAEVAKKIGKLQRIVSDIICKHGPMTAAEAGHQANRLHGVNAESARKRVHECVARNLVSEGPPRECTITGKRATTYRAWSCR